MTTLIIIFLVALGLWLRMALAWGQVPKPVVWLAFTKVVILVAVALVLLWRIPV